MRHNLKKTVKIGSRQIGERHPTFIVAEAGSNHTGDIEIAKGMIDEAVNAGADAIKFQAWKAERMVSKFTPLADYQKTEGKNFQDLLKPLEFNKEQNKLLKEYAEAKGIIWYSTPFDEQSADMLEELDPPAYKIGSGEVGNIPFLEHIAKKGKPIIFSTGMAYLSEVDESIRAMVKYNDQIIILHCTSTYPSAYEDLNLRAMETLDLAYEYPIGLSDHTLGIYISMAAVALGACVIEKHFTLDRNLPGWDQKASIEPHELREMVQGIRQVEKAVGKTQKRPAEAEFEVRSTAYKSIIADMNIPKGSKITRNMLTTKRPGIGLEPRYIDFLVGCTAKVDIKEDTILTLDMIH